MVATDPALSEAVINSSENTTLPENSEEIVNLLDTTIELQLVDGDLHMKADGKEAIAMNGDTGGDAQVDQFMNFIEDKLPKGTLENGLKIQIKDGKITVTNSEGNDLQTMDVVNDELEETGANVTKLTPKSEALAEAA